MSSTADTRTQIMDAFSDQLSARGYSGISLAEIARTVGIQKPSIYHHFSGGKEDLYVAVAERYIDTLQRRVQHAVNSSHGLEDRLAALAVACTEPGPTSISFEQRVYDALGQVGEATRDRISALYVREVLAPVTEIFAEAVRTGDVTGDPEFMMNAFLHLARAMDLATGPDAARRLVTLFLDGARPRPA
ncbi:TetR/AcrR family transcriptional regulator [Mycolicibacterium vaccae]|uniref:TetR/AcrR family transcriptional regulator n=1 Tax=Mycolicibacterium vaccae TaxID=1810 RepID=UPI003D09469A